VFSAGKCDHKIMGTFLGGDRGDGSIIKRIISSSWDNGFFW